MQKSNLYVALLHFPVLNKEGSTMASAVTNLDLHDIARSCCTYDVARFFVISPLEDQKRLVKRIVGHWTSGVGAKHNPDRKEALSLISLFDDLSEAVLSIKEETAELPYLVATTAKTLPGALSYEKLRYKLKENLPCLLLFGTAWGLSDDLLNSADYILEPIAGNILYNHLSVRSAAAIILDRLKGRV